MRLPTVPGLEITLSVEKRNLEEFDDPEAEGDDAHSTRYVEAVSGANFAVEFRTDRTFAWRHYDLSQRVYLDGVYAEGFVLQPEARIGGHIPRTMSGRHEEQNGQPMFRKFAFADLTTTDGQPRAELKKKLKHIGEVTVKMYRVRTLRDLSSVSAPFAETIGPDGIAEKALKGRAISSRATLSKAEPSRHRRRVVDLEYPWGTDPFATFSFKYRSRRDLQIEGIIPRSPSPVPLEERDPDTLTAEEARELVRIQRQQLQDRTKVKKEKREREEDGEGGDGEVTMTGEQRKRQRTSTDSGIEVIDLSNETDGEDD